jgi:hypothetical protein
VEQFQKEWGKVVAKAWSDELFKKRLFADPKTVLTEHGIEVPADVNVKVMEDSGKTFHLILPERPSELTVDELSQVAGGGNLRVAYNTSFNQFDQKSNQLFNLISTVIKSENEMSSGITRNIIG